MTRRGLLAVTLVLGAAVAVVPLHRALAIRAPRTEGGAGAAPVLPRAAILRPLLLGFHAVAADLYWIRTIQYFGAHMQTDRQAPDLYPLVDLVTSLDPHFVDAYQLGGLFLTIGKRFPEAITIYEKGIAANPGRWELSHDLGRLYFLDLRDEAQALRWWELTNRLPGRPDYVPRFLARLYSKAGFLETAVELWTAMYEGSDNEWVRDTAKREIRKLLKELEGKRHVSPQR